MRSHLISQVVLREFTNPNGEVLVHDLETGTTEPRQPLSMAFQEVDKALIGDMERQWNSEIETHAAQSLRVLKNGDLLHQEKHIKLIKRLLALHYIRTQAFFGAQKLSGVYRRHVIEQVAAQFPDRRQLIEARVDAEWPKHLSEATVGMMKEYIPKVEGFIEQYGFEIGVAPEGSEFILADVPVITADGKGNYGALNGVPTTESKGFAMPLTPTHIVALKKNPTTKKYRKLNAKEVENANHKQLALAVQEYYSKS